MISHMLLSKAISPSKHYKHCYPNYLVTYGSFFPFLPCPPLYDWGNRPETCVLIGICLELVEHLSAKRVNHPHNQTFCLSCLTLVFSPLCPLPPHLAYHLPHAVHFTKASSAEEASVLHLSPCDCFHRTHALTCYLSHQTISSTAEEYYPFPFPKIVYILKIECQVYSRC